VFQITVEKHGSEIVYYLSDVALHGNCLYIDNGSLICTEILTSLYHNNRIQVSGDTASFSSLSYCNGMNILSYL